MRFTPNMQGCFNSKIKQCNKLYQWVKEEKNYDYVNWHRKAYEKVNTHTWF